MQYKDYRALFQKARKSHERIIEVLDEYQVDPETKYDLHRVSTAIAAKARTLEYIIEDPNLSESTRRVLAQKKSIELHIAIQSAEELLAVFHEAEEIDAAIKEALAQPGQQIGKWTKYDLISAKEAITSEIRSLEFILMDTTLSEAQMWELAEQKSIELGRFFGQARELSQDTRRRFAEELGEAEVKGAPPLVFICYAREDESKARLLYSSLKDVGFKPWINKEDILPGEKWDLSIRQAIRKADFRVVCLSKKSVAKQGYVNQEIRIALEVAQEMPEGSISLIPIRFDECAVPDSLSIYQYVDLFGGADSDSDSLDKLIRAIRSEWDRRTGRSS